MAEHTNIPWTDHTWNWSRGCPGNPDSLEGACKNCYMRIWAKRAGIENSCEIKRTSKMTHDMPLTSKAIKPGDKIFTLSLGDFFHELNDPLRPEVWDIIRRTPQYIYQILTKWPENVLKRLPEDFESILNHIWLGFTAENQDMFNMRVLKILELKKRYPKLIIFWSCEPMLGPINARHIDAEAAGHKEWCWVDTLTGKQTDMGRLCHDVPRIDWVICGGETGSNARPLHPEWVRSLRDQCQAAGIPFFFKQFGEWIAASEDSEFMSGKGGPSKEPVKLIDGIIYRRIGKKAAGDLLDDKQYHEFPEVSR